MSDHGNGMREIRPALGSTTPEARATVNHFNEVMQSYKKMNWAGLVEPANYGPPMGKGHSCVDCHNSYQDDLYIGYERSHLNYANNLVHLKAKVVDLLNMPHGFLDDPRWASLKEALHRRNNCQPMSKRLS